MTTANTKPDSPSAAVERALAMLEAVAQVPDGLSNAEISRKLNIPKSSASYLLQDSGNPGLPDARRGVGEIPRGIENSELKPWSSGRT